MPQAFPTAQVLQDAPEKASLSQTFNADVEFIDKSDWCMRSPVRVNKFTVDAVYEEEWDQIEACKDTGIFVSMEWSPWCLAIMHGFDGKYLYVQVAGEPQLLTCQNVLNQTSHSYCEVLDCKGPAFIIFTSRSKSLSLSVWPKLQTYLDYHTREKKNVSK